MRVGRAWLVRVLALFGAWRRDRELRDEIASHLELHIDDNVRGGMSPAEARRSAILALGGLDPTIEAYRDRRGVPVLDSLRKDAAFSLRLWRRQPAFTGVAVLTLAFGIGVNVAVFGVISAIKLRGLPVNRPDQLVFVTWAGRWPGDLSESSAGPSSLSYPLFHQVRSRVSAFSSVTGLAGLGFGPTTSATVRGDTAPVDAVMVAGNFFQALGVRPVLGRTIVESDERSGHPPVAVLSHDYWMRVFDGAADAIGRTLTLNGVPMSVVGVAAADFVGPFRGRRIDVWIPFTNLPTVSPYSQFRPDAFTSDRWLWVTTIGRLRPGVTIAQARERYAAVLHEAVARATDPGSHPETPPQAVLSSARRGVDNLSGRFGTLLTTLQVIAAVVLLIACANLASLLLEQGAARRAEMGARLALGAGRGRLVQQLVVEGLMLAVAGAALGLGVASIGARSLVGLLASGPYPVVIDLRADPRVLAAAGGLALLTALIFSVIPAFRTSNVDLVASLRGGGRAIARRPRGRGGLVCAQMALSLVLLTGAGLFAQTLRNLEAQDLGFDRESVLLLTIDPAGAGYRDTPAAALSRELLDRLGAVPGVRSATVSELSLLSGWKSQSSITLEDGRTLTSAEAPLNNGVGPGFFETMGIPVRLGRGIEALDVAGHRRVAVVNEAMARTLWPLDNPLGRRFSFGRPYEATSALEIVGVVGDAHFATVRERPRPTIYFPYGQRGSGSIGPMTYGLRVAVDPMAVMPEVRRIVADVVPHVALTSVKTEVQQIRESLVQERILSRLSILFALAAVALSVIGLYGLLAYHVRQRVHEFGVRFALGARRHDVLGLVLRRGTWLSCCGIGIGVAGALATGRLVESYLFGIEPTDPITLAGVSVLLFAVGLAASSVPALRAQRVDPMTVLREG